MMGLSLGQLLLFVSLGVVAIFFVLGWIRSRSHMRDVRSPSLADLATGFVTALGDTLGIGSFAPTTAIFKLRRNVADENIPGTLNVGHTSSGIIEAFVFVVAVIVDPKLLVCMIGASCIGAWLGAGIVGRLPRRAIQIAMGVALLIACSVFIALNLKLLPGGGEAMALQGWKFALAVGLNFVFGALMSVGIGLYAPCMVMLALLGMHPIAAFPIMTGSCALLQPIAALRFFRNGRYAWGPALGLALGGPVGVFIAVTVVKSLPLESLRWLVSAVVVYAAASLLHSAYAERPGIVARTGTL